MEKKRRRHVTEVVSEESTAKEIEFVLSHLAGAERMQRPATSEDERRRRREITAGVPRLLGTYEPWNLLFLIRSYFTAT